jgi:hypothetical protein
VVGLLQREVRLLRTQQFGFHRQPQAQAQLDQQQVGLQQRLVAVDVLQTRS